MALVVLSGALPGCMIYSDRQRRRNMNYYTAPMEGLTDPNLASGAPALVRGARRACPLLCPPSSPRPRTGCLSKRRWQSWTRKRTPAHRSSPADWAKDGALAAWMIGELRKMGYTEVNLNFGCPSGTVTAKGKGAGMLRDLSKLEVFLDESSRRPKAPSRSRPGWASQARRSSKPSSTSTTAAPSVS
mgnify:CR=1 FL=1